MCGPRVSFKESRNGISVMISIVLLVAFAISVTALMMVAFSTDLSRITEGIGDQSDRLVSCSGFELDVSRPFWTGNRFSIGFSHSGNGIAEDFVFTLFYRNGSTEFFSDQFNGSLRPGESASISFEAEGPVENIRVSSKTCPEKTFDNRIGPCPSGMVLVDSNRTDYDYEGGPFCIFKYEASRNDANSTYQGNSEQATSFRNSVPWYDIPRTSEGSLDAEKACENSGFELVSNRQWQAASSIFSEGSDSFFGGNTGGGGTKECREFENDVCLTGSGPGSWCNSLGVCDMKGNLAEWTSSDFGKGSSCDRGVNGYVESWDVSNNCPELLGSSPVADFDGDYYTSPDSGEGAVVRGGSVKQGERAGPFYMNLSVSQDFSSDSIGFRCVLD